MNRRRKTFSTFRRASDRGRNFPGHRAPQPTFSQTLRDMSFGDILPGSIEKRIAGNWITPEEAAVAIRDGDGSGIRIAILDSGVEIGHPDFRGRQLDDDLVMDDVNLGEFAEGEGEDTYGHGTAIAGLHNVPSAPVVQTTWALAETSARNRASLTADAANA